MEATELSKPFYTSEIVFDSSHPQWCVFHESQFVDPPESSQKKLLVCLWEAGEGGLPRRLLHKVRIDLSELCFISTMALDFSDCTILFELQDGIYATRSVRNKLEERGIIVSRDFYADEENSKRYSCSRSAYIDIISKKRELKAKKDRIALLTQQIQLKRTENAAYYDKLEERNELAGRLATLKAQYDLLKLTFQKKKQELEAKASVLLPTAEKLRAAQIALATSVQEMEQRRVELMAHQQQLVSTFFLIRKHQERLIRDLANVYRIVAVRDQNGNEARSHATSSAHGSQLPSVLYSINGCTLNNSHFHGQDEEKIATGLGYVCHLVQLLSKYLDIPLRYPMQPMMSRSTIQDVANNSSEKFPLYSKAQNIDQFRSAVVLLNRNVEQLVLSQRLKPIGLRDTLPNLRLLLDQFIGPHSTPNAVQMQQIQKIQEIHQQQQIVAQDHALAIAQQMEKMDQTKNAVAPPPTLTSSSNESGEDGEIRKTPNTELNTDDEERESVENVSELENDVEELPREAIEGEADENVDKKDETEEK